VKRSLKNGLEPSKPCDRHPALADDAEADILAWIQHQAEKFQPSTRTDILHYCVSKFGKSITRGWVDSFLIRHDSDVTETMSNHQDNPRLQVPRKFLAATICSMEEALHGFVRD
jgi:hypothetical protein